MPSYSISQDIAPATTEPNILAGTAFEFAPRDQKVAIALSTTLAGLGDISSTVMFGADVQMEDGYVPVEAQVGGGPVIPNNVVVDDVAAAGDRLVIRIQNVDPTNPHRVNAVVRILPL